MTPSPSLVVLLVEDDDTIRELTAMLLEGEGHTVHTAANGDEADRWLETGKANHWQKTPRPDVLFTDVRMPGKLSGQELALRHAHMPVLVTSGETREQHPWLTDGMRYLAKPYDRKALLAALREVSEPTTSA